MRALAAYAVNNAAVGSTTRRRGRMARIYARSAERSEGGAFEALTGLRAGASATAKQARQESNLQPPVLETGALPIELRTYERLDAQTHRRTDKRLATVQPCASVRLHRFPVT